MQQTKIGEKKVVLCEDSDEVEEVILKFNAYLNACKVENRQADCKMFVNWAENKVIIEPRKME